MSETRGYSTTFRVLACLAVLAIGWRMLSLGLADNYSRSRPESALGWRQDHPVALLTAAQKIVRKEPARASEMALSALGADPLEGRAYRVLGEIAEQRGDLSAALQRYQIASIRSPRDLPTHFWLERHYLSKGQLVPALQQADLLLRIEPRTKDSQFPLLQSLAALPQAHVALAKLLAQHPPWRETFVVGLSAQAQDSVAIAPFMGRLRLSPAGLFQAELHAWMERLIKEQRWGEAYLTWASTLPSEQQSELGNLFNGGFEREPSNSGFDWRFDRVGGAYIEREAGAGVTGDFALRISFEGRRVPFKNVRQLLALSPGRYRLSGRGRADGLRSERGLVWSVFCADTNLSLADTDPLTGQGPWRPFFKEFVVPAEGCGGQWLQLAVPARIAAEQRIGGRAWFDDLRIVREQ